MPRAKKVVTELEQEQEPLPIATEPAKEFTPFEPHNEEASAPKQERISIPLNPDGTPDFSKMRTSTIDKFKKAVGSGDVTVNASSTPKVPDDQLMTYEEVAALFDMLGPIEGYAIALFMKVPVPLAMKVFTYTDADKAELVPAAMALANKYGIKQYLGYLEETRFMMVMYKVTTIKMETLKTLHAEEKRKVITMQAFEETSIAKQPEEQVTFTPGPTPATPVTIDAGFATVSQ
jgi:hypothetical protein